MKRITMLICLCCALCVAVFAQQIPSDWDTKPPRDTDQWKYAVGISQPSSSEQEAYKSAWYNAVQQFTKVKRRYI